MDTIVELLARSVTGELDEREQTIIDNWLGESAANRELYARISDGRYLDRQYGIWSRARNPNGWNEMQERMAGSRERRRRSRAIRRLIPWLSAAAVVAGVVAIRTVVAERRSADEATIAVSSIMPGRNTAFIDTGGGRVVPLDGVRSAVSEYIPLRGRLAGDSMVDYRSSREVPYDQRAERHTLGVPQGATTKIAVLADGTTVWLNAGSTLTYPVAFAAEGERIVEMTGEGYFDVRSDPSRPFVVHTQGVEVRVTGTAFNLNSYPAEGSIATTLVEGAVKVSSPGREVVLSPGTQAVLEKSSGDVVLHDVDVSIYTAWKEGVFEFDNMPVSDICLVLSRWYDIRFEIPDPAVGAIRFTGTIGRERALAFILELMRETGTIDYSVREGRIVITN
ncbi:MAG: DUF4974 domain-containing protein [Alistipes sp.]|jgi:ferric-dicitrate binding protein FerR (iron transport regulator)|nr:DUF4974 domain-containing protein [Alistipes sp.]